MNPFQWITAVREVFRGNRRANAVQPIIFVFIVLSIPCAYLATTAKDLWLQIIFALFASMPVILFPLAYLYFMMKDRDRLHSEDFQLRNRSLDLIESKGGEISYRSEDILNIANPNPSPPKLGGPSQEGDHA